MNSKEKPLKLAAGEAGTKLDGCLQNSPPEPACQVYSPISWLIRSNFIESLVSQRYTAQRSLKVDGLLVCAEFLEEVGHHVWN